jgi:predicted HNH restriction endonuclease
MIDYNSSKWKKRRLKFIKEQGENLQCVLCDKKAFGNRGGKKYRIHVHHTSYEYPVGEEPDSVLRVLCPSCHELVTLLFKRRPDSSAIHDLQTIIMKRLTTNYNKE